MKKVELIKVILKMQGDLDPELTPFEPYTEKYLKDCDGSELRGIKATLDQCKEMDEEIYERDYIRHGRAE